MKKILGISLVAMMAVTTARADIASKDYVDTNFQATSALVKSTAGGGTGILSTSTDAQYPSAKAVYAYVDTVNTTATNAIQGVSVNNTELTPDANKKIAITIAEGATNGTIAVNGDDVDVHGLGSAAYADTTAFDAAGAATTAVNAITATGTNGVSASASNGAITVSGTAATDAAAGVIKIASAEEITAGTSTTTAVTPAQLAAAKSAAEYDDTALAGRVTAIEGSAAYTSGITSALVTQIGTNQTDIATLNGNASTSGSVANTVQTAITALDLDNTYAPIDVLDGVNSTAGTGDVANGNVVTQVTQSDGVVTVTHGNAIMETSATGTDGVSVLTRTVDGTTGAVTYKWETIQR